MDGTSVATLRIRTGKEKQLVRHHPWVFSGALEKNTQPISVDDPQVVRLEDARGNFIAYGWYDQLSHIPIRLLSWDKAVFPDVTWWADTLSEAVRRRMGLFKSSRTSAFRLVHGEADFLPGLTVDVYNDCIVCIVSARVAWTHRLVIVKTLQRLLNPSQILISVDNTFGGIEQLKDSTEFFVDGESVSAPAKEQVTFLEHGIAYRITLGVGQKSGFFCDQRENRKRVASYALNKQVLDAFCYSGGFALNVLAAGAKMVTAVDSSAAALEQLSVQLALNIDKKALPTNAQSRISAVQADVFQYLRDIEPNIYDMIVLDPPKLAQTKGQVEGALRAYKDVNRLAMQKIRKGGLIATFSCSGGVSRDQFRTMLAWAAKDVDREVQILETLGQGADHPIRLSFPESEYLKGYIIRVL